MCFCFGSGNNSYVSYQRNMSLSSLLCRERIEEQVIQWLKEDTPSFDYGGYVVGDIKGRSVLLCKSDGFLCGKPFVDAIFKHLNCVVTWHFEEGDVMKPICEVAQITGNVQDLLRGERVALNVLARASGIVKACKKMINIKNGCGWSGQIAGTRKTTPGFRHVEKYSLLVGGCATHRYDLSSMVMLKDNHIWAHGSITNAVKKARSVCGFALKIEVECRSLDEALEACQAGADIVMLDNFEAGTTEKTAKEIKEKFSHVVLEVSGGIRKENIAQYMTPSVDVISMGCLTQGYSTVDFSMKIRK